MIWRLQIASRVEKTLTKVPVKDQQKILAALEEMRRNPLSGDYARLKAERSAWRRRVGAYRIFFDVDPDRLLVDVVEDIARLHVEVDIVAVEVIPLHHGKGRAL